MASVLPTQSYQTRRSPGRDLRPTRGLPRDTNRSYLRRTCLLQAKIRSSTSQQDSQHPLQHKGFQPWALTGSNRRPLPCKGRNGDRRTNASCLKPLWLKGFSARRFELICSVSHPLAYFLPTLVSQRIRLRNHSRRHRDPGHRRRSPDPLITRPARTPENRDPCRTGLPVVHLMPVLGGYRRLGETPKRADGVVYRHRSSKRHNPASRAVLSAAAISSRTGRRSMSAYRSAPGTRCSGRYWPMTLT